MTAAIDVLAAPAAGGLVVDESSVWRTAARLGRIGLGPYDLPEAARHAIGVLDELLPGSVWQLSQHDPVSGSDRTLAGTLEGHASTFDSYALRTTGGRLTGRLRIGTMPGSRLPRRRLPEAECTDQLLAVLGGFVDWMHGPLWLTTDRPANEYMAVITRAGSVIEIPGRDPGDFLRHGSELVRAISADRPGMSCVSRRWWIGASRRLLRLDLHGGPEGTLVMAQEMPLPHELSVREFEVISLVATGPTNAQIARLLFISESTVAKHVQSCMRKTGAASRAVLAANAVVDGVLLRPATATSGSRLSTISA